jgi:hypothetical protein
MPHYPNHIVQDRLELRATELHQAAETLPHGDERESLLQRALRMEAASLLIDRWMSSPGLRSPR